MNAGGIRRFVIAIPFNGADRSIGVRKIDRNAELRGSGDKFRVTCADLGQSLVLRDADEGSDQKNQNGNGDGNFHAQGQRKFLRISSRRLGSESFSASTRVCSMFWRAGQPSRNEKSTSSLPAVA